MSGQDPTVRPRIRRDTQNGMIGGVAAGFARHLDIDVVWVRLAFVLLTVFGGGFGLVAYLAAWLIVPADDGTATPLPPRQRRDGRGARFWTGVGLVAIGALILLDTVLSPLSARIAWASTSGLVLPLVLIGIGALIYRSSRDGDLSLRFDGALQGDPAFAERIEREAESFGERIEQRVESWGEEVERVAEDWEARIDQRSRALKELRSRSRVAPATFGAALITLGALLFANALDVPGITITRALAATLLVIGAGLVAGAFLGRGRGLIVTGALLAPVVALAALVPQFPDDLRWVQVDGDGVMVGEAEQRTEAPQTLAALPADGTYEFGVGSFVVDLRALGDEIAAAGTVTVIVEVGIGNLRILVPDGVTVSSDVELGIGRIRILDATRSGGIGVTDRDVVALGDGSGGTLVLVVRQGIGDVTVTR
jgi:phage shock protein PspC (stress-responsive transcriptional regulator)